MLQRWAVGETKPGIPVATWNSFCDATDIVMSDVPGAIVKHSTGGGNGTQIVQAKNDSSVTFNPGDPVALWGLAAHPGDNPDTIFQKPVLTIYDLPEAEEDLIDPPWLFGAVVNNGAKGGIVDVAIRGLAWVSTDVDTIVSVAPTRGLQFTIDFSASPSKVKLSHYSRTSNHQATILGVDEGTGMAMCDIGRSRGVELVLLTETVGAAQIFGYDGDGNSRPLIYPQPFTAPLLSSIVTVGGVDAYAETPGPTIGPTQSRLVAGVNYFLTSVDVSTDKAKIATLVDGVLTNVDCAEFDYDPPTWT